MKEKGTVSPGYAANMEGVAAVDRAFAIVKALEQAQKPLTLTEVAEATGLYKSTILRTMASLEKCMLVVRREDQKYILGSFAFLLGKAYEATVHIEERLIPIMQRLVEQGAESPSFHVKADSERRLCILRIDSNHATLDRVRQGSYLPLDKGAAGRVLSRVSDFDTPRTQESILEVSHGERDPSCSAVAGPVYGPGNELLGSLSLSGPMERFNDQSLPSLKKMLLDSCKEATNALGGTWMIK